MGSRRWIVPVLGAFGDDGGARFAQIAHRASISPESLKRTLNALIDLGWVHHNKGYGHPLRPEYRLTVKGCKVAKIAKQISVATRELALKPSDFNRWAYALIYIAASGKHRFSEIEAELGKASPRALAQSLKKLVEAGLIERTVKNSYPPKPHYTLTEDGQSLAKILQ